MHSILDDLNEAQREAVTAGEGPLLVLAGAGSGKTRVITRRVAWLMQQGVEPRRILALTFTNKAAKEMADRVAALVQGVRPLVTTFHSACARFLRVEAQSIGFTSAFTIFDTYDRDQLLRDLLREEGIDTSDVRPGDVGARISRWKNERVLPGEPEGSGSDLEASAAAVYPKYVERMKQMNAFDFDDLLLRFLEVLESVPERRDAYRKRFLHLLVDEYQDTNRIQYLLLRQLVTEGGNLCVVGDPDQSIYRFRGADLRNILDFEKDFPGTRVVRLELNYRSSGNIVAAADAVIRGNRLRQDKRLVTENPPGEKLCLLRTDDELAEAAEIVAQVRSLRSADPSCAIGVFYRAHFLSRALEEAFRRAGIPYVIVGDLSFFERREIKDLLAYLRAAINPRDDVSLQRILNVPTRGVGEATEERLVRHARELGVPLSGALERQADIPSIPSRARAALDQLSEVLKKTRDAGASSVRTALEGVLEATSYIDYACRLGDPRDRSREENVLELVADAMQFDAAEGGGLQSYLARVGLMTSEDRSEPVENAVSMMTIHSAKGLEFDNVFLLGLEQGLFPHERSLGRDADMEEERRLFYVGLTRARKRCFLLHAKYRTLFGADSKPRLRSQFVSEIPEELLESERPEEENGRTFVPEPSGAWMEIDLAEGDLVLHEVFGRGRLLRIFGRGTNRKATVFFPGLGEKTLLLEMARLLKTGPEDA